MSYLFFLKSFEIFEFIKELKYGSIVGRIPEIATESLFEIQGYKRLG